MTTGGAFGQLPLGDAAERRYRGVKTATLKGRLRKIEKRIGRGKGDPAVLDALWEDEEKMLMAELLRRRTRHQERYEVDE